MRIGILGAGGVGGYFGARLAVAGYDVTFIARGKHLDAMRSHGLVIKSSLGDFSLEKVQVVERASDAGEIDIVFVTVKLWDTEEAVESLVQLASQGTAVVSFQNGVQKDEILQRYLPKESIFGGVSYIAAVIGEPGVIVHSGAMQKLGFGEYDGHHSARVLELQEACSKSGINCELSNDIRRLIWEKYVFLVGLSGTTSAVRKPIGVVRQDSRTRELLLDVMREVVAVGQESNVALPNDFASNRLAFCDTLPFSMTSSMHNDLERGNRLELPWLSGGVVELGDQLKVPTPCNRVIADILSPYALGALSNTP